MNNDIQTLVTDFHKLLYKDENHRYKSWEHCYSFFKSDVVNDDIDKACLHLAFYLASWGMYRGSSFLLWKDYKIHMKVVERILQNKELQYLDFNSANEEELEKIIDLSNWIKNWYKENIDEVNGEEKNVNVTDTLVTKILLGTLGCIPAYDRYFVDGMRKCGVKYSKLSLLNLKSVVDFYKEHNNEFDEVRKMIFINSNIDYPAMKLIDMYFWEIGFRNDN